MSAEHGDDKGRQVAPQRPYRNLAVACGAVLGIVCGIALAAYLTINAGPLKGWGWIIGFPVGVAGGSTLGFFVLLKVADLLSRKR